MKTLVLIAFTFWFTSLMVMAQGFEVQTCNEAPDLYASAKISELQSILDQLTHNKVPGAVAAIWDESGYWEISSGYSKIEGQVPMQTCHLHYIQSITKTYMAVSILQLSEEGKIALDEPFIHYLPSNLTDGIPNSDKITVRMLLNHTSGIREYNDDPTYVTRLLQNPNRIFQPEEYLDYIRGKKPDFEPGSKYSYRNTNYLILALIAEKITGNHKAYMKEKIFKPLGLKNTFYRIEQGDSYGDKLVNSYWDRYSNSILENVSVLQNSNVVSMIGDDGTITTPKEAVIFLKGFIEGKLLSESSMEMMQEWVLNRDGKPVYGLGLNTTLFQGFEGIGHSGGGLGSGSQLYYFPKKDLYIFLAVNMGTVTQSPIHKEVEKILDEVYRVILN
ncbi:serine hydrolase domain-containing protein [Aquiflexum sp.]|uniref:serine hydrolase domain-containing protein n=1 Tax=Aquiflexum sp. TaxID=1872584 RepID=UPI00359483C4